MLVVGWPCRRPGSSLETHLRSYNVASRCTYVSLGRVDDRPTPRTHLQSAITRLHIRAVLCRCARMTRDRALVSLDLHPSFCFLAVESSQLTCTQISSSSSSKHSLIDSRLLFSLQISCCRLGADSLPPLWMTNTMLLSLEQALRFVTSFSSLVCREVCCY